MATYDLGDLVPLAVKVTNSSGVAADSGQMTYTITLPDLTVVGPTVVASSPTGTYGVDYASVQSGRHTVRWIGTGTNACTFSDVFDVFPADPGLLISLDDARKGLLKVAADTLKDEDLRVYIQAATPIMEDLIGNVVQRTVTEQFNGGAPTVVLNYFPTVSVTTVLEYQGLAAFTITNQPLGGAQDGYGYTFDSTTNRLTRRSTGGGAVNFPNGVNNVVVTYITGRTTLPSNARLATRKLIAHLWQQDQQGFRPSLGIPQGDMAYTPSGFAVPKAVVEMVADLRRPAGMF